MLMCRYVVVVEMAGVEVVSEHACLFWAQFPAQIPARPRINAVTIHTSQVIECDYHINKRAQKVVWHSLDATPRGASEAASHLRNTARLPQRLCPWYPPLLLTTR